MTVCVTHTTQMEGTMAKYTVFATQNFVDGNERDIPSIELDSASDAAMLIGGALVACAKETDDGVTSSFVFSVTIG